MAATRPITVRVEVARDRELDDLRRALVDELARIYKALPSAALCNSITEASGRLVDALDADMAHRETAAAVRRVRDRPFRFSEDDQQTINVVVSEMLDGFASLLNLRRGSFTLTGQQQATLVDGVRSQFPNLGPFTAEENTFIYRVINDQWRPWCSAHTVTTGD
jgi:hypothetical protein